VRVVVVGGGAGGLATALILGRAGHEVVLLEQDPLPATTDVAEVDVERAFTAERRGAPQVHQTHGFLARLVQEMKTRFPDVLDDLRATGVLTMNGMAALGEPREGDEDLSVLIVRRTTLEWVLRTAVQREPGVDVRGGARVTGLVADHVAADGGAGVPLVTGVTLADGSTVRGDVVVSSNGRRSTVPAWLDAVGAPVTERVHESGLMYVSRWYRFPPGNQIELDPKLGGDLGFVKYLAVPGDQNTLSVTLAIRSDDSTLRATLTRPGRFEAACRALPGPDTFFRDGDLEPMTDVLVMGGLLNRIRRFTDADGAPLVHGFHAVGDAHTCTNPLYGRGCSLAFVQAGLLADAVAGHGLDHDARARAYEAASARDVEPWFEVSLQMDRMGADPKGIGIGGGAGPESPEAKTFGAVMVAAQTNPVIGRAFARFWNLLSLPTDLMADAEFLAEVAKVAADPDAYPLPPRLGPSRDELLDHLAAAAA
jgi:2-polyprenyl-6-methoxyphenol hydroxylase-like FAD-dependent oxidoreductase